MLRANTLFLLLLTALLACTSKKTRSPAPTTPAQPGPINNMELKTLQQQLQEQNDSLNTLRSKFSELPAFDSLQQQLSKAQGKVGDLEEKIGTGNVSKEDLEDLEVAKDEIADLKSKLKKLKEEIEKDEKDEEEEDTDVVEPTGDNDDKPPTPPLPEPPAITDTDSEKLAMHVLLVEFKPKNKDNKEAGTYVTFHSNKEVMIKTIEYKFEDKAVNGSLVMLLPVTVEFTDDKNKRHCATATLDLLEQLKSIEAKSIEAKSIADSDNKKLKGEKILMTNAEGKCS